MEARDTSGDSSVVSHNSSEIRISMHLEGYSNDKVPNLAPGANQKEGRVKIESEEILTNNVRHDLSAASLKEDSTSFEPVSATLSVHHVSSTSSKQKFPVLKGLLNQQTVVVSTEASAYTPHSTQQPSLIPTIAEPRRASRRLTAANKRAKRLTKLKQPVSAQTRKCKAKNQPKRYGSRRDHSSTTQDNSSMGVLQVDTSALPAWARQVFSQARTFLCQQNQQGKAYNHIPDVRIAVEVLKASQWWKHSKQTHKMKSPPSPPAPNGDIVTTETDLDENTDGLSDVGDIIQTEGVLNPWDGDWLSPTVLEEANATDGQVAPSQADDSGESPRNSHKKTTVKFICRLCKKVCSTRGILKRHMIEKHSERRSTLQFKCRVCGSMYKRKYCLVEHMRVHTGEKSVKCTECDAKFRYRSDMRKHYRHKHGGKKYVCKVCGRSLRSDRGFKYHMSTHDETLPIVCDRCGRSFRCKIALKRHHEYAHKEQYDSKVMCEMCSEMFPSETALSRHQRTAKSGPCRSFRAGIRSNSSTADGETSFLPVTCQECGAGFRSEQHLKMHMGFHTGTRPFLCSECNLAYSRKDHYNTHCRIHRLKVLESKTFDCQVCGVGMRTEKQLEMHMGFHTGERPFQCSVCHLAFAKKDRLDTHSQSHNADRVRYPCIACGASFCTKALLKYHCVLRHAAETPHVCTACGDRFDRKCHLQQHMKGPCTSQAQNDHQSIQASTD